MKYITRHKEAEIIESLNRNPATAIVGPRQCGKSTTANELLKIFDRAIYLDLERPSDLRKITDPEWYLSQHLDKLVCMDEIQRKPELFPLLRSLIDEKDKAGMYLILGSASRDLLQQSSETLAGRIHYVQLSPFLWTEIHHQFSLEEYLYKGGFPRSLSANSEQASFEWRQDFIATFLERDLLQFKGFPPKSIRRLWQMLAHNSGQTLNLSQLGSALGLSHTMVRKYIDLLEGTFMVHQVPPFVGNTKKRLVKSPKVYISDSGIATALLELQNYDQAAGHPVFGSLWESVVLTNLKAFFPFRNIYFYRTQRGQELDFIIQTDSKTIAIECKASVAPELTKGNHIAYGDVKADRLWLVAPVRDSYALHENVDVITLEEMIRRVKEL